MGEVREVTLTLEAEERVMLLKGYLCWDYSLAVDRFGSAASDAGVASYDAVVAARAELDAAEGRVKALGWPSGESGDIDSPIEFTTDADRLAEILRLELGSFHESLAGADEEWKQTNALADFRGGLLAGLALVGIAEQVGAQLEAVASR